MTGLPFENLADLRFPASNLLQNSSVLKSQSEVREQRAIYEYSTVVLDLVRLYAHYMYPTTSTAVLDPQEAFSRDTAGTTHTERVPMLHRCSATRPG